MLKLDDGKLATKHIVRMLHLLVLLARGKSDVYAQSVLMECLLLAYQKEKELPMWDMFVGGLSCFNEEAGEISFAMLARSVRGDTTHDHLTHLRKMYALIHSYAGVERLIKTQHLDVTDDKFRGNWRKKVDPDGWAAQETRSLLSTLLRQIKAQSYRVYPGTLPEYKSRTDALQNMVKYTRVKASFWDIDFKAGLEKQVEKCRVKYKKDWMSKHSDIWPEFKVPEEMVEIVNAKSSTDQMSDVTSDDEKSSQVSDDCQEVCENDDAGDLSGGYESDDDYGGHPCGVIEGSLDEKHGDGNTPGEEAPPDTCDPDPQSNSEPSTPTSRGVAGEYLYDNTQNVLSGGRASRANRGTRIPDTNFPYLEVYNPTPELKKRRRR